MDKHIITGWIEPVDKLYLFKSKKKALKTLTKLQNQFPQETKLYIADI